jgi:small-conductance mechanosensitive channel/CRP-like cAMP-binding protein
MRTDLWWALGLFVAVVLTAAIVNALAPGQRIRVRRIVILFGVYALCFAGHHVLEAGGSLKWAGRMHFGAELLQAFTVVNIVSTLAFLVLLPKLGVSVPMIASDLAVGIGYILATLGVLSGHGLDPSSVLATSAVVSAVLAISLQSTLGNILGGVALQLDGSIHEGDWLQLDNGRQGKVRSIRWRHTVLETRDFTTIIVPNVQLLANNILILGKRDGRAVPTRMWVWFNVDYRYPPTQIIKVVTDALRASAMEGIASDPQPNVVCMDFAKDPSVASYAVRYWLPDMNATDSTTSRIRERIYTSLRRAGIPLAVPAQTMFLEVQDDNRLERHTRRQVDDRLAALKTVTLFRHLTENELRTLAEGMSQVIYTANEIITRQGAVAHWLYLLTSGKVQIRANVDPDGSGPIPAQSKIIATLDAPDFFGEMGLMTGEPRMADVVAVTPVECFRLGKDTFQQVVVERPEMADELSETLASRRVNLIAKRDGLDPEARLSRHTSERERILEGIKGFFGL